MVCVCMGGGGWLFYWTFMAKKWTYKSCEIWIMGSESQLIATFLSNGLWAECHCDIKTVFTILYFNYLILLWNKYFKTAIVYIF